MEKSNTATEEVKNRKWKCPIRTQVPWHNRRQKSFVYQVFYTDLIEEDIEKIRKECDGVCNLFLDYIEADYASHFKDKEEPDFIPHIYFPDGKEDPSYYKDPWWVKLFKK